MLLAAICRASGPSYCARHKCPVTGTPQGATASAAMLLAAGTPLCRYLSPGSNISTAATEPAASSKAAALFRHSTTCYCNGYWCIAPCAMCRHMQVHTPRCYAPRCRHQHQRCRASKCTEGAGNVTSTLHQLCTMVHGPRSMVLCTKHHVAATPNKRPSDGLALGFQTQACINMLLL